MGNEAAIQEDALFCGEWFQDINNWGLRINLLRYSRRVSELNDYIQIVPKMC